MKSVASLITESGEPTIVVLSAMSGTTNSLVEISNYLYKKNPEGPMKSSTIWKGSIWAMLQSFIRPMNIRKDPCISA